MYVEIGLLRVGDKFEYVNQPPERRESQQYVITAMTQWTAIFTAVGGHVELGMEKNHVVKVVSAHCLPTTMTDEEKELIRLWRDAAFCLNNALHGVITVADAQGKYSAAWARQRELIAKNKVDPAGVWKGN